MNKKVTIIAATFAVMLAIAITPMVLADDGASTPPGPQAGVPPTPALYGAGGPGPRPDGGAPGRFGEELGSRNRTGSRGKFNGTGVYGPRNLTGPFIGNFTGNRTQLREEMQARNQEMRNQFNEHVTQLQEQVKQRREEMKIEIQTFKEQINATRARMKELQADYAAQVSTWRNAKTGLNAACKTNSTQCQAARQEFNDAGKQFIGNAADQMLTQITDVKTRIQADVHLDSTTISTVVGQLDAQTAIITADKAVVDGLQNSSDVNATKKAATKLRDDWRGAQVTLRLSRELLTHAQFQQFLDQLTSMSTRFSEARVTLSGQGKDVTQLDADIASFNGKLNTAATAFTTAKTSYVSAMATVKTDADASSLIKSTNDQLKAARDDLQSARGDLRNIIKDIRTLDGAILNDVAAKIQADENANATTDIGDDGGAQ